MRSNFQPLQLKSIKLQLYFQRNGHHLEMEVNCTYYISVVQRLDNISSKSEKAFSHVEVRDDA